MAALRYGEKRRLWRAQARAWERKEHGAGARSQREPKWVAVPARCVSEALGTWKPAPLVLVVGGRYRIEVGEVFAAPTLARLLETLEAL